MSYKSHSGFTLIELIIVIVILGILAVTAAPRFIDMRGDAVLASLNAMQGAFNSANTLVYSKAVLAGTEKLESSSISTGNGAIDTRYGYIMGQSTNVILVLEGSYEDIFFDENVQFIDQAVTADWGVFSPYDVSWTAIIPRGYGTQDDCYLVYDGDNPAVPAAAPVTYQVTNGC